MDLNNMNPYWDRAEANASAHSQTEINKSTPNIWSVCKLIHSDTLMINEDLEDLRVTVNNLSSNNSSLQTQVATNTANIATNTANIATNTANIATNTANIATNTTDITNLQSFVNTCEKIYYTTTLKTNVKLMFDIVTSVSGAHRVYNIPLTFSEIYHINAQPINGSGGNIQNVYFIIIDSYTTTQITYRVVKSKNTGVLIGGNVEGLQFDSSSTPQIMWQIFGR